MSEQSQISPQDPLHYAPRWLRERPEQRPAREARPEPAPRAMPAPASLDTQLEKAVYESLRRPLEPSLMEEPPELARELDRGSALFGVAARFGAAIGVSAIVALFFVFMVPASRQPDTGSSLAAAVQSVKAAVLPPHRSDDAAKPALAAFRPFLAEEGNQPVTREQSQHLLGQFMQWQKKTGSTDTSQ